MSFHFALDTTHKGFSCIGISFSGHAHSTMLVFGRNSLSSRMVAHLTHTEMSFNIGLFRGNGQTTKTFIEKIILSVSFLVQYHIQLKYLLLSLVLRRLFHSTFWQSTFHILVYSFLYVSSFELNKLLKHISCFSSQLSQLLLASQIFSREINVP